MRSMGRRILGCTVAGCQVPAWQSVHPPGRSQYRYRSSHSGRLSPVARWNLASLRPPGGRNTPSNSAPGSAICHLATRFHASPTLFNFRQQPASLPPLSHGRGGRREGGMLVAGGRLIRKVAALVGAEQYVIRYCAETGGSAMGDRTRFPPMECRTDYPREPLRALGKGG